jgi:hypothetical protein
LMMRNTPYLIAMAIVLCTGLVTGVRANRWHDSKALDAAAARLEALPMRIGEWEGEAGELPARIIEQSEVSGYVLRRYKNPRTRAAVSVFIGCGRPGPVAVHTPEVCYAGGGYELLNSRPRSIDLKPSATKSEMVVSDFRNPPSQNPGYLRIFWAMSADGTWAVPASPRFTYRNAPVLFKIYVTRDLPNPSDSLEDDACYDFSRILLPELNKTMFPAPRSGE